MCIGLKIKCLILLMHGATMKFISEAVFASGIRKIYIKNTLICIR